MKVSALISSLWTDNGKPQVLNKCIKKLKGADEILALVTEKNTRLGFSDSWNRIAKISTGDYLIFIGDNNFLQKGNLRDLCIKDTITYPRINNVFIDVPFTFCVPRNIYEKIGLYDDIYNKGINWEEIDFWRKVLNSDIKFKGVDSVNFYKPEPARSIKKLSNKSELFDKNKSLYIKKWGDSIRPEIEKNKNKENLYKKIKNFIQLLPFLIDRKYYEYKKNL